MSCPALFRPLFLAAALAASAAQADETAISTRIAQTGLAATAGSLAAAETPGDRFALGGVLFLRGIETALQTRWRHGLSRSGVLPVLRLPVPPNPAPEPFRPDLVAGILRTLVDDMAAARVPLQGVSDTDGFGVVLALDDIWFDIDMDGNRGPEESLMRVAGTVIGAAMPAGTVAPTIRFDTADAAWLTAYAHLLSGIGKLALAFDPTGPIATVLDANAAMSGLGAGSGFSNAYDMMLGAEIDIAAIILLAVQQQPDAGLTREARAHWLSMIAENRRFWRLVAAEADNFAEWIPNGAQVSALGIPVPPGMAETWQAVLADAEDVLEGRKLIPFWRLRKGAGINLKRLLEDPVPVDPVAWAQGAGLVAYMEDGPRIGPDNWWRLQELVRGDAALFAIWLN